MPDFTKLPKWARDEIADRDRAIRDLTERNETLRGETRIDNPVGYVLSHGYRSEPIPLGEHFRVEVGDLEICRRGGDLAITTHRGYPAVLPEVSNVIKIRHLPYD